MAHVSATPLTVVSCIWVSKVMKCKELLAIGVKDDCCIRMCIIFKFQILLLLDLILELSLKLCFVSDFCVQCNCCNDVSVAFNVAQEHVH